MCDEGCDGVSHLSSFNRIGSRMEKVKLDLVTMQGECTFPSPKISHGAACSQGLGAW
jgi:hypothetical protein